ncbi:hypothetical protein V6N12_054866 [Hibiscus sabdariffa]|uniref:Uncharacterized protein n=1 Tax=Hibiscus sabdariffa TaxID=183260 RepID=A0ABR2D1N5_9ROSI
MSNVVSSIELNTMWEGNKRVDWRVLEHDSRIAEEDTGMIQRVGSGSKDRAMIAEVIEIGRQQRKVRQLYEILMSEVPPEDRHVREMECAWKGLRQGEVTDSLVCKLREMKRVLKVWNRDSFRNVDVNYRELVDELEQLDTKLGVVSLTTLIYRINVI